MRYGASVVGFLFGVCMAAGAGAQQDRSWWVAIDMGEGQLSLTSDQKPQADRTATFALGFSGGHRLTNMARVGLHVNGWLLEASSLNDPTVGESVSNVGGVLDVFPIPNRPLFVRGGLGLSMYENNHPTESGGSGLGWEAGGGYEFRLPGSLGITPMVEYSAGHLGGGPSRYGTVTGRQFSVVEFKVAAIFRFGGKPRK